MQSFTKNPKNTYQGMYKQESIKPYGQEGEKRCQVETMFDNIAPTYDTLNHRLSWNIDRSWRRKAIDALEKQNPQHILDIATGTGDFAILAAKRLKPQEIIGADISEGMMKVGETKVKALGLDRIISFQREDCTALSFPDNRFDAVTVAFGLRNFQNLEMGLAEMCRVLKPGGLLCALELATPVTFPMKQLFGIYSHTFLPLLGRIVSKDTSAYPYLTKTIEAFPQAEQMMDILCRAGFSKPRFHRFTFGICTLYLGVK